MADKRVNTLRSPIQQQILLMELANRGDPASTTHILDPQPQPQPLPLPEIYATVTCRRFYFRIMNHEFKENSVFTAYAKLLWLMSGLATVLLIIIEELSLDIMPYLIATAVAFLPINAYALSNRETLSKMLILSSVALHVALIASAVLLATSTRFLGVVWSVFGLFQVIGSCFLVENKGKILLKVILHLQLVLIAFKLDEVIGIEWRQVLFGFIILIFFIVTVGVFVVIYISILGFYQEQYFEIKKMGLLFVFANLINIGLLMGVPAWIVYIDNHYLGVAIFSVVTQLLTALFIKRFRTEIALFLCDHVEAASHNDIKVKVQLDSNIENSSVYKVSENWCVVDYNPQTCEKQVSTEECIVCMTAEANIAWMPCGHLTLCEKCCMNLLETRITNCPICKDKPSKIYKLSKQDNPMREQTLKNLRKNEFHVVQAYSITAI